MAWLAMALSRLSRSTCSLGKRKPCWEFHRESCRKGQLVSHSMGRPTGGTGLHNKLADLGWSHTEALVSRAQLGQRCHCPGTQHTDPGPQTQLPTQHSGSHTFLLPPNLHVGQSALTGSKGPLLASQRQCSPAPQLTATHQGADRARGSSTFPCHFLLAPKPHTATSGGL